MDGVLPVKLENVQADSEKITTRFYRACVGWIRYKPLLLYITQREQYESKINEMRENLLVTLPKICAYFESDSFMNISKEFERYNKNVARHYGQFIESQAAWRKITNYLSK
jgi:hypothetical protein